MKKIKLLLASFMPLSLLGFVACVTTQTPNDPNQGNNSEVPKEPEDPKVPEDPNGNGENMQENVGVFYKNKNVQQIKNIQSTSVDENNLLLGNDSPQLSWDNIPEAKSYVVTMVDLEAAKVVGVPFIHWLVANVTNNSLEEKAQGLLTGSTSLTNKGYFPPAPPDENHNYTFRIFALDIANLNLQEGFKFADLQRAMAKHVIAEGETTFVGRTNQTPGNAPTTKKAFFKNANPLQLEVTSSSKTTEGFFNAATSGEQGVSPQLSWSAVPGAQTYLITMIDNDAANVIKAPFIHWVVANLKVTTLKEGASTLGNLPFQGENSFTNNILNPGAFVKPTSILLDSLAARKYLGPTPPDKDHLYTIRVYALDSELQLNNVANLADLHRLMHGKVLGTGALYLKGKVV